MKSSNETPSQYLSSRQQRMTTRTDVATARRSLQDLKKQTHRMSSNLNCYLSETTHIGPEAYAETWDKREKINEINNKISEIEKDLMHELPSTGSARLSDEEKQQIRGLHSTKLYTQKELADQYGVSQPTVGDIIRDD